MLHDADDEAADDVDEHDDQRRDRVAADELRRTVHGAVEVGRALDIFAALPRFGFGDQAGVEIGVDGKLFAGHRVQGEARGDFRDAARTVGDDDELDDDEDREDHEADGVIAADHDRTELLDDLTRVAVQQDRPRRADVQREPEERDDEDQRREDAERERVLGVERREHDDERHRDVQREQHVEHPRRDRHDHQNDQNDRRAGNPNLGGRRNALGDRRRYGLLDRGGYRGHEVTVIPIRIGMTPEGLKLLAPVMRSCGYAACR